MRLVFLTQCLSKKSRKLDRKLSELLDFASKNIYCELKVLSDNALHILCYAAKILELTRSPGFIVEFGSGYGCLAHIFKQLLPDSTLLLIDLPELLAIQYLYLQYALPNVKIIFHSNINGDFEKGAIHLMPVHFIANLNANLNADIFVSTFAISESPLNLQQIVYDKQFFGASLLYLSGQLNGWHRMFEDHYLLHEADGQYIHLSFVYHIIIPCFRSSPSYEIIATDRRN